MMVRCPTAFLSVTALSVMATHAWPSHLASRADPDNTVSITDTTTYCLILPREPHTNIGDSEHPGGMKSHCTASAKTSPEQGDLSSDFWINVALESGNGKNGQKYIQLTGCIRPETSEQLNPSDTGGQYDSSGGDGGQGNPQGSACTGYNHYVELVEPAGPRACIRCCDDPVDCPTYMDTSGCPNVIPGNYFNCG